MKGLKRIRGRFARARMSLGGCRELRRAVQDCSPFRRGEDGEPQGPGFGSWF